MKSCDGVVRLLQLKEIAEWREEASEDRPGNVIRLKGMGEDDFE